MLDVGGGGWLRPSVTVVICAYTEQRWGEITQAVCSVRGQERQADQIVLVVDHEPSLLGRSRAAFPDVTVVPNTGRRGLSGARNTGLGQAWGDVVAFLDDDAEADHAWLTRLLSHYRDPDVLAVGGRAVPRWERPRPHWLPPEFDWVIGCSFTGQPVRVSTVRNLIGCNMSFRRELLRQAGGFDPVLGRRGKLPVGCEETELCIRLRTIHPGGVILYDPAAVVHHRVSAERARWDYFRRRCFAEGRSKAVVTRLVGTEAGLATEREYTRRTLPLGIRRELRAARTGDPAGLVRAATIVTGLAITTTGYLAARAQRVTDATAAPTHHRDNTPRRLHVEPVQLLTVELSQPVPALPGTAGSNDGRYGEARVLVRLHGQPLGVVNLTLPPGGLTAEEHARLIQQRLEAEIADHLRRDGLTAVNRCTTADVGAMPCTVRPILDVAPSVTVVVPTCGREMLLRRCLAALSALDYPDYEILVVDNAPQRSETAGLVADHALQDPRVRYTHEPQPGVTHARARGLTEAKGTIVAFTDDDVVVDPGWLRALVEAFTDENVAAVTGHVLASELQTPAQIWVEQYGGFDKGNQRRRFDATGYDNIEHGQPRRISAGAGTLYPYLPGIYGTGANMAFRADILRAIGGFDPLLGSQTAVATGEDIDVLMRLVLAGHTLVYEPSAIVWHTHKRDLAALRRTIYNYGVGLGAVMTKCLITQPTRRRDLITRLPHGLLYALHPNSVKNAAKTPGYPRTLTLLEICGMTLGPLQYAHAAWTTRRNHTQP